MTNQIDFYFLGDKFSLEVTYDCYESEEVTKEQVETVSLFNKHKDTIATKSISGIKGYCEEYMNNIGEEFDETKLRSYINPNELYVKRSDDEYIFAIMCDFSFDLEHGIAIVFSGLDYMACGPQDIIL